MTPLAAVPLNSWTWLVGTLACFALYYRSSVSYRRSATELSKYLSWFALSMGCGQALLAVPAFFTLDTNVLRATYLAGEFFIYTSGVAQAAIVWCLVLRRVMPLKALVIPTVVIGMAAWAYAIPNSTLHLDGNFVVYRDPLFSTIVIGVMLLGLFLPVGLYFLRAARGQAGLKSRVTSLVLGLVYIGVGVSTGGVELIAKEVITPYSAIDDLVFFTLMLGVLLLPRRRAAPQPVPNA